MNNLDIREFSNAIINFVNQSQLPVELKRLCVCDIARQLQVAADDRIQTEIMERDKKDDKNRRRHELTKNSPEDLLEKQKGTRNK